MSNMGNHDVVQLGSWVKIHDFEFGDEDIVRVVEPDHADKTGTTVPADCPLGQALLGCKPGETVCYSTPQGEAHVRVLATGEEAISND